VGGGNSLDSPLILQKEALHLLTGFHAANPTKPVALRLQINYEIKSDWKIHLPWFAMFGSIRVLSHCDGSHYLDKFL
jgi:hypothetical protein